MWGHTGVYCLECKAEWNYTWHTEWEKQLVLCPNCNSKNVAVYNQTVPFAIGGGHPPDYVYRCICGSVFQSPPKADMIDPYERNPEILTKLMEVTCPFCKRDNKFRWYIPKK